MLTKQDYEIIDVNKEYKVVRKNYVTDKTETVIEFGDALMEEENGSNDVISYEEINV